MRNTSPFWILISHLLYRILTNLFRVFHISTTRPTVHTCRGDQDGWLDGYGKIGFMGFVIAAVLQ